MVSAFEMLMTISLVQRGVRRSRLRWRWSVLGSRTDAQIYHSPIATCPWGFARKSKLTRLVTNVSSGLEPPWSTVARQLAKRPRSQRLLLPGRSHCSRRVSRILPFEAPATGPEFGWRLRRW